MNKETDKNKASGKSAQWDSQIYFTDDVPEDVVVDTVEGNISAGSAKHTWGPHPPFRKDADLEQAAGVEDNLASRPKRRGAARILLLPFDALNKFVFYSGITKRSPLMATVRMILVMLPVFISIYLSYLSMSYIFPRYDRVAAGGSKLISADANGAIFTIGAKRLRVPIPAGWEVIPVDEYNRKFPLTAEAAMADKCTVVFAARATDDADGIYYINLAADNETAGLSYSEAQFKKMLDNVVKMKDIQSSMQVGPNQIIGPFNQTPLSACYGRMMSGGGLDGKPAASLRQYTCMLFLEGRAVVINAGYSMQSGSGIRADDRFATVLTAWRDSILQQ